MELFQVRMSALWAALKLAVGVGLVGWLAWAIAVHAMGLAA